MRSKLELEKLLGIDIEGIRTDTETIVEIQLSMAISLKQIDESLKRIADVLELISR